MLRIGIFGGTFNPPHNGHIYIAKEAVKKAGLDRMIFVPCGNPYHKIASVTVDKKTRFDMACLAVEGESFFEVSDIELKDNEPSYTAKTLAKLKELYPDDRLCFLVGGDSLLDMEGWYKPEDIFKMAEIIVANRGGREPKEIDKAVKRYSEKYNAQIKVIEIEAVSISASDIRGRILKGQDVGGMLPANVFKYIEEKGIYKDSI